MSRRPIIAGIQSTSGEDEADPELSTLFREAMARFPSGVTVVAARDEDEVAGITASAVTSVSVDPPLVLVCLGLNASVLPFLQEAGGFTVNVLGSGARALASRFSQQMPDDPTLFEPGDAVLRGSAASVVCRLEASYPGGDHRIIVGRVERVVIGPDQPPLAYYRREYRELA